jgi:hypothetical protein
LKAILALLRFMGVPMPIPPDRFPPLNQRLTRDVVASMIFFAVIGLIILAAGIAHGGWWGSLGVAFTVFVVGNALWVGINELRRRRRC